MKNMELPHVTAYQINPKEDELILEKKDYKKKVKYLQELIGKLNYIRSRGRICCRKNCQASVIPS